MRTTMRNCSAENTATPALISHRLTPSHSEKPRCDADKGWLLTTRRRKPKRSTTNPKPIKAIAVRCQASKVRSAANKTRGSSRYDMGAAEQVGIELGQVAFMRARPHRQVHGFRGTGPTSADRP
jgi:hypothetical protein